METVDSVTERTILFIGDQKANVYESKTISCVKNYMHKKLHTSDPANWQEVLMLIKNLKKLGNLAGIVIDLSPKLLVRASLDDYYKLWKKIFCEIKQAKSLILIRKDLINDSYGGFQYDYQDYIFSVLTVDKSISPEEFNKLYNDNKKKMVKEKTPIVREIIQSVLNSEILYTVYDLRIGAIKEIVDFLDTIDPGVLLRIYLPRGNFQEKQFAAFLKLFEEYMVRVEKTSILIDQIRSEHGTIYIFKSHGKLSQTFIEKSIASFYSFLDFAKNDVERAKIILQKANLSPYEKELMLNEFNKAVSNIKLDLVHEFEKRVLFLRHTYENKLLGNINSDIQTQGSPINPIGELTQIKTFGDFQNNIFNINFISNPVINNDVNQSVVEEIFNGDIHYGVEDKMLFKIIDKLTGGVEKADLNSAVGIAKDKSAPQPERKIAYKKLEDFLKKVLPKIGEAAFNVLIDYLKKTYFGL